MDLALLKERAKAKQLYREYESIQTLLNNVTVSIKARMKASYEAIDRFGKSELRRKIHEVEKELRNLRSEFGVKATRQELMSVLQSAEAKPGLALYIVKAALVQLIGQYEKDTRASIFFQSIHTFKLTMVSFVKSRGILIGYFRKPVCMKTCALSLT